MPKTSDAARCTALTRHGDPCARFGLDDAPFPICLQHAAEILRYLNAAAEDHTDAAIRAARHVEQADTCEPLQHIPGRGQSVVYYARIGQYIKIGHSRNLIQRMRFYPPDTKLLAIEPGDETLEEQRLAQFRGSLKDREEWFAPSVALLEHIKRLSALPLAA